MSQIRTCRLCSRTRKTLSAGLCEVCTNKYRPRRQRQRVPTAKRRELVRRLYLEEGESDASIAAKTGVTYQTIQYDRKVLGIPSTPRTTAFKRERHRISYLLTWGRLKEEGPGYQFRLSNSLKAAKLGWPGLYFAEARLLSALRSGPKSARQLATELGHTRSRTTKILCRKVHKAGLVTVVGRVREAGGYCGSFVYALTDKARKIDTFQPPDLSRREATAHKQSYQPRLLIAPSRPDASR